MKYILLGLMLWFSSAALAQDGFIAAYHPFPTAKKIAVRACQANYNGLTCPHGRVLTRRTAQTELQLRLELFGTSYPIAFKTMPAYLDSAWNADLNRDGKADVIIKITWGGNGIAGDGNLTVFALSSQTGYRLTTLSSLTFDPDALIFLRGKPTILHTSLLSADSSKTGRIHSFWVFYPLEIRGSQILRNTAPIWIQYTFTPSHRRTNKLLALDKTRALRQAPVYIFEPMR